MFGSLVFSPSKIGHETTGFPQWRLGKETKGKSFEPKSEQLARFQSFWNWALGYWFSQWRLVRKPKGKSFEPKKWATPLFSILLKLGLRLLAFLKGEGILREKRAGNCLARSFSVLLKLGLKLLASPNGDLVKKPKGKALNQKVSTSLVFSPSKIKL